MRTATHYCVDKRFARRLLLWTAITAAVFVILVVFAPYLLLPKRGAEDNNRWWAYTDANTAIVFVHGIYSNSRACWSYHDKKHPDRDRFWPEMVAKDRNFRGAAVFLAGYYTSLRGGRLGVDDAAEEVWAALDRPDARFRRRPLDKKNIIFICHSTGGIVARYLLVKHADDLREKNVGLVLIASPSAGSEMANGAGLLASLYDARLAGQLQTDSPLLADLDANFRDLLYYRRIPNLAGVEAYEHQSIFWGRLRNLLVVKPESAGRYFRRAVMLPDTNHFSSVKPRDATHPAYKLLTDFYQDDFVPKTERDMRCRKPFEIASREWQTENGAVQAVALSPDGHSMAYVETVRDSQRLMLAAMDKPNSARQLVAGALGADYLGVTFDAAGEAVYYVRGHAENSRVHELRRITLDGDDDDQVLDDVDSGIAFNPADPRQFAYCHGNPAKGESSIRVARIDDDTGRAVVEKQPRAVVRLPQSFRAVTWSPSGTVLLTTLATISAEKMSLVAFEADGHRRVIDTGQPWRLIDSAIWLRSGDIVFAGERAGGGAMRIWLATPSGSAVPITYELADYDSLSVDADEKRLVAVTSQTEARVYALPVVTPKGIMPAPITLSRTANRYDGMNGITASEPYSAVFTRRTRAGQDLMVFNVATQKTHTLAAGDINDAPYVCGNTGYLVFARVRDGQKNIWRATLDGKSAPLQITRGAWDAKPSCSDDAARIVYSALRNGRRATMIIDNGEPRILSELDVAQPAIAPDGKRVAIIYGDQTSDYKWRIGVIDVATGTLIPFTRLNIASERALHVQWRDDKTLTILTRNGGIPLLWSLSTATQEARPIVRFPASMVFGYSWTPDRQMVVYSGGEVRRDVVMLAEK